MHSVTQTARILLSILALCFLILGYGYWHAKTHGTFNISMYDASEKRSFVLLRDAEFALRDEDAQVLAKGQSDSSDGTVYLSHPETGSCYEAEHKAGRSDEGLNTWQICFQKHATWIMEWVRRVRFIDIHVKGCRLEKVPVLVEEYAGDWWMWWVPLPHVGGKPYTYFSATIRLDPIRCLVPNQVHQQ